MTNQLSSAKHFFDIYNAHAKICVWRVKNKNNFDFVVIFIVIFTKS